MFGKLFRAIFENELVASFFFLNIVGSSPPPPPPFYDWRVVAFTTSLENI